MLKLFFVNLFLVNLLLTEIFNDADVYADLNSNKSECEKKFLKILNKIDLDQGVSQDHFKKVLEELYQFRFGNPNSIKNLFQFGNEQKIKEIIRVRIMPDVLSGKLFQILEELGLSREPNWIQKLGQFKKKNHQRIEWTLTALINASSLYFSSSVLGYLPKIERVESLKKKILTPEMIDRISQEGFDSVYPDLRLALGDHIQFELYYKYFRNLYHTASALSLGYFFYTDIFLPVKKNEEQKEIQEKENAKKFMDKVHEMTQVPSLKEVSQSMLNRYIEKFKNEFGREPTQDEINLAASVLNLDEDQ